MKWRVVVWCRDCYEEDHLGCFDGGKDRLDEVFDDAVAAKKHGEDYTRDCGPWEFEVVEESKS